MQKIIQMISISKSFVGVKALTDVSFDLHLGEIHALLGENGAGKSTLINVLTGVFPPNAGEIKYNDKIEQMHTPLYAQNLGISTVYQEINLLPELSIAENIFLGHQPRKRKLIDWKLMRQNAVKILARFDVDVDVDAKLGNYSIAIKQIIAIARALALNSTVLILDEPTSSLNDEETDKLFTVLESLRDEGYGIIFVTHFLDQVFKITNRATILRDGNYVGTYKTDELTKPKLVSLLLGKELDVLNIFFDSKSKEFTNERNETLLQLKNYEGKSGLSPVSIDIKENEVIGCVGLLGSGRTEFANLLFGIDPARKGTLVINKDTVKIRSPYDAVKKRIGFSPEDRKTQGIIGDLSIRENIVLALQSLYGWNKNIKRTEQEKIANQYIDLLKIKTPSAEQLVKNLSGGNQQKVIIARWLVAQPHLLILDEPTRGIDIGAKTEIQELIVNLKEKGVTVLFISTEIEEIVRCSSRVMIMHDLQFSEMLENDDVSETRILEAIISAGKEM